MCCLPLKKLFRLTRRKSVIVRGRRDATGSSRAMRRDPDRVATRRYRDHRRCDDKNNKCGGDRCARYFRASTKFRPATVTGDLRGGGSASGTFAILRRSRIAVISGRPCNNWRHEDSSSRSRYRGLSTVVAGGASSISGSTRSRGGIGRECCLRALRNVRVKPRFYGRLRKLPRICDKIFDRRTRMVKCSPKNVLQENEILSERVSIAEECDPRGVTLCPFRIHQRQNNSLIFPFFL